MSVKHSLIVPCYNEEGNVENFLKETKQAMMSYTDSYEIIFVNDGSKDGTPKKLREIFSENKDMNIKVINFSRNFGKEAAMYAGFTQAKGEYITIIDADLQQDPKYAVEMAKILDSDPDCDMVAAYQSERKEGKLISLCKSKFYGLISKMSGIDFVSDASDFRTMRRCVADTIVALPEYHRFSKGIFSWVGYNTVSIPYEVRERESGETKWNFKKLLAYAFEGIIAYTDKPLKFPLYLGLVMLAVSVVLGFINLFDYFYQVSTTVLFVGGLILISQGIIGAYLGKVHTQVKDRPIFIAKEILTYEDNQEPHN
ncbi:MAG: glycosyltransferase family 2 protein [Clostridia bacterium]|nr:glycosyltransferase family 2 protein [Clostridia bacterium]